MTSPHPFFTRNVFLYIAVRFCVQTVMQIQGVALGWFVYAQTGSAFSLGLIGLAQFLPSLPTLAYAGYAADRHDRRKVIMCGQGVQAFGFLGLCLTIWYLPHVTALIYLFVVVTAAARQMTVPSMTALLPSAVPRDHYPRAIAISSSAMQFGTIIGPALGGLGYALIGDNLFAALILFPLVSIIAASMIDVPKTAIENPVGSVLERTFAGFAYIKSNHLLLGMITLDLFAVLFGGVNALLPIFAQDVLNVGPTGLGILTAGPAVGAVLLGLVMAWIPINRNAGQIMLGSVACYGVAMIIFGFSTNFLLSLAALTASGAFDMISMVIRQTVMQTSTPDAMRGRVSAVSMAFAGASNQLGNFESGAVAALVGAVAAAIVGGIGTLVVVAGATYIFPEIRRSDRTQNYHLQPGGGT